ncbi:MAG: hypothetical protein ACXAE3_10480 [Candidatus Kariarchaeaceae archaeon]|jgi:hypothetical protein
MNISRNSLILITIFQVIDVLVHVLSGQFELVRVLGSVTLIIGSYIVYSGITPASSMDYGLLGLSVYLMLNIYFVAINGLTNPETDSLRVPLFLFVLTSAGIPIYSTLKSNSA